MRDILRYGGFSRYGLALLLFFAFLTASLGQIPPPAPKSDGTQATATPPPTDPTTPQGAQSEAAKPQDATPIKPPDVKAPEATTPPAPAPTQPSAKGSAKGKAPKKGKGPAPTGGGDVTAKNVQEKPYIIGPEDILFLSVLHQQDVSGQVNVRPDGFITARFIGEVKAAGLTTQQLTDVVTEKFSTYFNHPEVNIQVVGIRSKKYYISGEVKRPGSYTLSTPRTIYEALIEAGGPADFAKTKKIYILRSHQKIPFNYSDVSKGKNLDQNVLLENGDVIVVP